MQIFVQQNGKTIAEYIFEQDDLINGAEFFIGRSDDCHIVLDDHQISRHHVKLRIKDDGIYLDKLSKLGKVTLNGNEIVNQKISNDDAIGILDYSIMFKDIKFSTVETYTQKMQSLPDDDLPIVNNEATEILTEKIEDTDLERTVAMDSIEEESMPLDEASEFSEKIENQTEDNLSDFDEVMGGGEEGPNDFAANESFESNDNFSTGEEDFGGDEGFSSNGEDGFGDAGFDDGNIGGFNNEDSESTQVFQSFASYSLKLFGEHAPYDKYKIEDKEIFIGRDPEKCQIVLDDNEVSSVHAVIRKNLISCVVEDLNSSNGTILNGERINKEELKDGDEFLIGSTSFTVEISNDLIQTEQDRLMPVDRNQEIEVEEIVEEEVDFNEMAADGNFSIETVPVEKSIIKRILKDKKKRPYVIIAVVLFFYFMVAEDGTQKTNEEKKDPNTTEEKVVETQPETPDVKKELPPEILEKLEQNYVLAMAKYEAGAYYEAREYLDTIVAIDPNYKDTQTLVGLVKQGYEELTRLKQEEQAEKERRARQLEVEKLVAKAKEATDKKEVVVAESLFTQILEKDPENIDVPQMRLEIDAYKQREQEKKIEEARIKAERQRMVDALAPGKALYLREDWFQAILQLEKFVRKEGMAEDLLEEATDMIKQAKINLSNIVNPLLGKARSFKEGQDLKRAYEVYGEILKTDPSSEEALNEREEIKSTLDARSKKIYRDALISESLSLFAEAREKFEEVQQISPTDSEYYEKATEKLENYLE